MSTTDSNEIINIIRKTVRDAEPEAKVILFGSRARGDAHEGSDWDVLILIDSPTVSRSQFKSLNYELWLKGLDMGVEINPVVYTKSQWENARPSMFRHNVMKEGIAL